MQPTRRNRPLVLVLGADPSPAACIVNFWRDQGAVVVHVRDDAGCLRVATAVGPDVIVLANTASGRLLKLLAAHPVSARARIERLPEHATAPVARAA
jgi:DNA-binding IclR family transcriptional regulator